MLAYRHLFHAGNFADVFKHALLTRLLLALQRKDKPFCYLDTHAGIGRYDLQHAWAEKLAEHRDGIDRIWSRDVPAVLKPYLEAAQSSRLSSVSSMRSPSRRKRRAIRGEPG